MRGISQSVERVVIVIRPAPVTFHYAMVDDWRRFWFRSE